jgi:septal ring factor EnvC (AmiA/AmiB activator)
MIMRNNSNSKRTEAILSLFITTALVITLAIAVASAIKRGSGNDNSNNYVDLNETQDNKLAQDTESTEIKESISKSTDNSAGITKGGNSSLTEIDEDDPYAENEASPKAASNDAVSDANETAQDIPVLSPNSVNASYSFGPYDTLKLPVEGEIILEYNMDNTIYFPTLNVYKCNPGLYISGAVGENVYAAATGTVSAITYDEEMGCTVSIDLGDGYIASYGQIGDLRVNEGEVVLGGAIIGTVAEPTIYYTTEGSGIYFKLTHNGEPENPLFYTE